MSTKILIVDDEPNLLRLIGYALQIEGYEIVTAECGAEGLSKVAEERPDLVVLDVMLPDMTGIEVCQQLRSTPEAAGLPIIMLSARAQSADKIRGLQVGADEYVTKPVDLGEMVVRVGALLERTHRLRQLQPERSGKVLGFMGAKGGVGTTTVVLNVASVLASQEKSVIAVELRPYHGTFSSSLNCEPAQNLSHLLDLPVERINQRELAACLVKFVPGFRVMFGPQKVEEFFDVEPEYAEAIVGGLAAMADYVVVDLPCYVPYEHRAKLGLCDFVGLVVEPEPTCVMSGKTTHQLLRSWGLSGEIVGAIVVNHGLLRMGLEDIRTELGCGIVGVVPPATNGCIGAQQRGVPLAFHEPDHLTAISLKEIAGRLSGDGLVIPDFD
jgi:DNA-binding response OmpR family regulator